MATAILLPIAEYLETSYRPDREYINGVLQERNVGRWEHARVQALLAAWLESRETEWDVIGGTAIRVRVAPDRVRIPDLVVLRPGPQPDILTDPPLLVIEILSPDDTYSDTEERAGDYRRMGVATLWIIDPRTRSGRMSSGADWIAADHLTVPGTELFVDLPDIFAGIGERA